MTDQPATKEQLFPVWYHQSQIEFAQTQLDGDIRQRASLVEWINAIDERVSKSTLQIHEHRKALEALGCTQVVFGNGTTGHILPCPVHPEAVPQ